VVGPCGGAEKAGKAGAKERRVSEYPWYQMTFSGQEYADMREALLAYCEEWSGSKAAERMSELLKRFKKADEN